MGDPRAPLGAALFPRVARRAALAALLVGPDALLEAGFRVGPYGIGRSRSARAGGPLSLARLRRAPHGLDLGPLEPCLPGALFTRSKRIQAASPMFMRELTHLAGEVDRARAGVASPDLVLVGRREMRTNNSWLHNSFRLVKGPRRCTLRVHPDDARERGLENGRDVRVRSRVGDVVVPIELSDEMMRGVVSLPHGWGHHREGARLTVAREHAGASINDLTDEQLTDRLTGTAAFSGVPVTLEPA